MSELKINRGDTFDVNVSFVDKDDNAIDITGSTVYFTAKLSKNITTDDDTEAVLSITQTTHFNPTGGETNLKSDDTDITPDTYDYDIQIKYSSGDIQSTIKGKFIVYQDVTKRTT